MNVAGLSHRLGEQGKSSVTSNGRRRVHGGSQLKRSYDCREMATAALSLQSEWDT